MGVAGSTALVQFAFVAASFAALTWCYVGSDFSVANVFENSHSAMPLIYKFTSVWGNHEGSMLLWVLILSLFGAMVALFGGFSTPDFPSIVLCADRFDLPGLLFRRLAHRCRQSQSPGRVGFSSFEPRARRIDPVSSALGLVLVLERLFGVRRAMRFRWNDQQRRQPYVFPDRAGRASGDAETAAQELSSLGEALERESGENESLDKGAPVTKRNS